MWPNKSILPFMDVTCPGGADCQMINCIYSHTAGNLGDATLPSHVALPPRDGERGKSATRDDHNPDTPSKTIVASTPAAKQVFTGLRSSTQVASSPSNNGHAVAPKDSTPKASIPHTVTKPVSPPAKRVAQRTQPSTPNFVVPLTVRKLQVDPAQFNKRMTFLRALFNSMSTLNKALVIPGVAEGAKQLHLSENDLKNLAIDEEARVGEKHKAVYDNVMRQRLVALKKMTTEGWIKERRDQAKVAKAKENEVELYTSKDDKPKRVETGLSPEEEVVFLSRLTAVQQGLSQFGYVTAPHTEEEIKETKQGLDLCDHWEACDRCGTRFQVFPNRREDGAITTGGKCRYHWGKRQFPRNRKDNEKGLMACCKEEIGSPGCIEHETHVFKVSGGARLSTIMPFVETPENDGVDPALAICFDCEMGYTTYGLEILRFTAVSWPSHKPVLDILVRPLGFLLDVNTRFSGITLQQFIDAKPYDPKAPSVDSQTLQIAESPYAARDLFLSLISPRTPLLGHALENDLNTIRLVHPNIVDTILLYPHPRGLPIRNSLRHLAERHLGVKIQTAGAAGHDSFEDAQTTGELIRLKVSREWNTLKQAGWKFKEGVLTPPSQDTTTLPRLPGPPSMVPMDEPKAGDKRKHGQVEEDESDMGGAGENEQTPKKHR